MQVSDRRRGLSSFTNRCLPALGATALLVPALARADAIGLSELRALDPTLTGTGVRVAQVEASSAATPPDFEVNPADSFVNQPASLFTYYSTNGTSMAFGNSVGTNSGHANTVAAYYYGTTLGVATNVSHVDNYDADYFINHVVASLTSAPAQVFNQSFVTTDTSGNPTQDAAVDQAYDDYIATYNKVVISGTGNSGKPSSPSTAYNGIAVGAYGTGSSTATGPTTDLRSKPDLVAPAGETSYSTPMVSGAAAILLQAGGRGDGGAGATSSAQDFRVVKALLLNGAVKPAGWAHTQATPLDPTYGAGVMNVLNAYTNLSAGLHARTTGGTTTSVGGAHVPSATTAGTEPSNEGWNVTSLTSSSSLDALDNYYFTLTSPASLTSTLDWERQSGQSTINNLDLYLYNISAGVSTLMDQSVSAVDNVEQLYDPTLPAGRYVIQVLKHGGATETTAAESYALAYNFAATPEPTCLIGLSVVGWGLLGRRRQDASRRVRGESIS